MSLALGALAWDAGYFGGSPDRRDAGSPGRAITADGDGTYRFVRTQPDGGEPVAYDPCRPIRLVVNPRTIVDDGSRILREAVEEVQDATGLEIRIDGLVDERPRKHRPLRTTGGSAWRPVLVAWTDPQESPDLRGGVAGLGGSSAVSESAGLRYVTGQVLLDGPQLAKILRSPDGRASVRAVVMHELGHVVGLSHVDDPGELMQPNGRPGLTSWGPGDRRGLAALGAVRCADD